MVESRVLALEQAGLEPIAIDVEAFALLRSLVTMRPDAMVTDGTIALVDMGATNTDVNIVTHGQFALTRNIPIAGDSLTNSIRSVFNIPADEAERAKLGMTIPADGSPARDENENRLWRAVQPLMEELLREIRRSVNYFQSQFPEGSEQANVARILLCGGSALTPGIGEYFSSKLNIPTEVADVFSESLVGTGDLAPEFISKHSPMLAIVVGLALKEHFAARLAKAA
jgi:type IV pilus assembly protein PilM